MAVAPGHAPLAAIDATHLRDFANNNSITTADQFDIFHRMTAAKIIETSLQPTHDNAVGTCHGMSLHGIYNNYY
jgi:hypothetical protein